MTTPTEQQVLSEMCRKGQWQRVDPVADLLRALGYEDVAKELVRRWDEMNAEDNDD